MSQILSQNEVDALLKGISGGDIVTESAAAPTSTDTAQCEHFDLTKPHKSVKLPNLVVVTEKFSRTFKISLSNTIRKLAEVTFDSTDMVLFDDFMKNLPVPTNINIFNMDPLRGYNILLIDPSLIFYMVDVLFGGSGASQYSAQDRQFTSIETTVIEKISKSILDDWNKSWESFIHITGGYVRSETNPQFAMIVPENEMCIKISFMIEIESISGPVTFCIPYSNIEPVKEKLMSSFSLSTAANDPQWIENINDHMQKVPVEMRAELGRTQLKVKDLLTLSTGDIIPLSRFVSDDLDVTVEGIQKFKGLPGTFHGNNAIQITSVLERR